jgi:hypothetical protein
MSEDNMTPENKQNNAIMIHPIEGGVTKGPDSIYTKKDGKNIRSESIKTQQVAGVGEVIDATASGLVDRPDYSKWSVREILRGVKSEGKIDEPHIEPTFREKIGGSWREDPQVRKGQAYHNPVLLGEEPETQTKRQKVSVEDPKKDEVPVRKGQARTAGDFFRSPEERVSFVDALGPGWLREEYDRKVETGKASDDLAKTIEQASRLGLNQVVALVALEVVRDIPSGERSDERVQEELVKQAWEFEGAIKLALDEAKLKKQIDENQRKKLEGYGELSAISMAARIQGKSEARNPLGKDVTVEGNSRPMPGEANINWDEARTVASLREEKEKAKANGTNFDTDSNKRLNKFLTKLLGIEVGAEAAEVGAELVLKAYTRWQADRKRMRNSRTEGINQEEKQTEPTKRKEPEREPEKQSEFSNFGDAYAFLKNNWRMEPHLNGEERKKYDEALRVKRMGIEAASKHGTNSYGENRGLFDQAKGQVADLMRQLITDDNYWATVQSSGMARGDIISKLADGLDPIRRATSDGQGIAQGIRDPWFEGIVRNWQLAFLKAKDSVGIPGNRADQIKSLQEEMRILNWGAVSTPETQLLIDSLANKAVSWEIQNDPNLKAWADAQARMETDTNSRTTTVETIETDHPVEGIFNAGFLKRHGLPEKFLVNAGSSTGSVVKKYEVDVLGALEKMYETGAPSEFFQTQEFINACNNPLEARKFGWGIVPLIRLIRTNPGTYSGLIDSKTGGGLIPELKLSIRGIATAFENDEEAKRCLGIFLQMDSQTYPGTKEKVIKVPGMQREDQLFAENLQAEYDTALRTNHLKWTNNESRDWWRNKAIQIAEHVGCDRGTAELMGEFAVLINGGPKMVDNRALLFKHANPNKPDGSDRFLIGNQFEEAALPFLAKIFVKKDDKEAKRLGKMGPRYDGDRGWDSVFLNDYLKAEGIDGLMQAVIHMQIDTFGEMRYIQALKGMGTIKSSMDEIKKLLDWGGVGRMAEKPADVMIKLKDAFSALVTPEVPLINQFTVQKIGRAISELDVKVGDVLKSTEPTAGSQTKEFGFQVLNQFGLGIPGLIRNLIERNRK